MSETISTSAPSAPSTGQASQSAPSQATPATQTSNAPTNGGTAQGQSAATQTPGPTDKEQTPPAKRYLESDSDEALVKIKVDGVEQEVSIKELKRLNSLDRASQKRMQEAAKVQREFKERLAKLQADPEFALKEAGKDPDAWAEERLARKYELAQMHPVERENLELKNRLEAQERMELESKSSLIDDIKKLGHQGDQDLTKFPKEHLANYRDHLATVNQQAQESLQKEMIDAWEATQLPKHKTWANWMAMEMMSHEKRTGEPLQAKDAALKVKGDWLKFNQTLFKQMDAPAIQELLGKEIVQKLIDHRIQGVTDQAAQGFKTQAPPQAVSDKKPYMTESEYRAWLKQG